MRSRSTQDNNAFGSLRDAFDSEGYDEWVDGLGLDDVHYRADSWYPWYCARTSAKLWTEMYSYLQTPSEAAQLLNELTEPDGSLLHPRSVAHDRRVRVQDKAGWCADSRPALEWRMRRGHRDARRQNLHPLHHDGHARREYELCALRRHRRGRLRCTRHARVRRVRATRMTDGRLRQCARRPYNEYRAARIDRAARIVRIA